MNKMTRKKDLMVPEVTTGPIAGSMKVYTAPEGLLGIGLSTRLLQGNRFLIKGFRSKLAFGIGREHFVVLTWLDSILLGGNHDCCTTCFDGVGQFVTVVSLVAENCLGFQITQQRFCMRYICVLPRAQMNRHRISQRIDGKMNLGAKSTA